MLKTRIERTVILVAAVVLLGGCFSLTREGGNSNTSGGNANQGTSGVAGASITPTPSPTPAPSATPAPAALNVNERVKFGKGKEGATLKGEVTANGSSTYTLGAKEGQVIDIALTSGKDGVNFDLIHKATGVAVIENTSSWTEALPSTGDYIIKVYSTKGGDTYTLKVSIRDDEGDY